jgi:hypothetical protein
VDAADGLRTLTRSVLGLRDVRHEGMNMRKVRRVTLLELVVAVQDNVRSDEEAVAVLTHLLKKSVKAIRPLPVAA